MTRHLNQGPVRRIPNHKCLLRSTRTNDILIDVISSGYCVKLRRHFRSLFLVSQTNPQSKMFFKSTAQIYNEQKRHQKYYYMIHPFSSFTTMWESVMIVVYLALLLCYIPLELSFLINTPIFMMYSKLLLDFICYVNIIITFFTGYVNQVEQKVELRWKKVAKNYIFWGPFIMEFVSSLPVTLLLYIYKSKEYLWMCLLLFKIFLLRTLLTYTNNYFRRRKFYSSVLNLLKLTMLFIIVVIWCTVLTIYLLTVTIPANIQYDEQFDWHKTSRNFLDTLTVIVKCILLVGPDSNEKNQTNFHKMFNIFFILLGSAKNMIILAQILRIYKRRNTARNKHQKLVQEIRQYTTYKQFPPDLKEKVIRYVDFKYHRRIVSEAEIMKISSEILREEIMLHKCQNLVESVDFFKDLPSALLMKIVTKLKPDVYLKNEVVFHINTTATAMYFVYIGVIAIYTDTGKELMHFGEGKHFGEYSLINNSPRPYSAIAKSDSELLRLTRKDLNEVLAPYPKLCARLTALGEEKQQRLTSLIASMEVEQEEVMTTYLY